MLCTDFTMFRVNSPEFGICKLEVSGTEDFRVMRLLSEDARVEYAIGESCGMDIADCSMYEDDSYYYLTSYLQPPVKTVRVEKRSMECLS